MFDDFLSESNADNHIYLEFRSQAFAKAMSNAKSVKSVRIKLSCYRGTPCLLFDMEMLDGISIRQDVSVKVLQSQEFSIYEEPNTAPPFVALLLFRS